MTRQSHNRLGFFTYQSESHGPAIEWNEGTFGLKVWVRPLRWMLRWEVGWWQARGWPRLRTRDLFIGPFALHWIECPWPDVPSLPVRMLKAIL